MTSVRHRGRHFVAMNLETRPTALRQDHTGWIKWFNATRFNHQKIYRKICYKVFLFTFLQPTLRYSFWCFHCQMSHKSFFVQHSSFFSPPTLWFDIFDCEATAFRGLNLLLKAPWNNTAGVAFNLGGIMCSTVTPSSWFVWILQLRLMGWGQEGERNRKHIILSEAGLDRALAQGYNYVGSHQE